MAALHWHGFDPVMVIGRDEMEGELWRLALFVYAACALVEPWAARSCERSHFTVLGLE
jgi:hypothetical protein